MFEMRSTMMSSMDWVMPIEPPGGTVDSWNATRVTSVVPTMKPELKTTGMSMEVMLVTPEQAAEWLANKATNRPINRGQVEYLRREIDSGNWEVTHQGIAFNDEDRLGDGQHRLSAVVAANKSVYMLVARGITTKAVHNAVDQGRNRTKGAMLCMAGETHGHHKAAICRSICSMINADMLYSSGVSNAETTAILNEYRDEIDYVTRKTQRRLTARFVGPMVLLRRAKPTLAEEFVRGIVEGSNLDVDDPRLALRDFVFGRVKKQSSSHDGAIITLTTACAAAAFIGNEKLKVVRPSASRFAHYCTSVGIPTNKSLYVLAGGGSVMPKAARDSGKNGIQQALNTYAES